MIAEFSIIPVGGEEALAPFVARMVDVVRRSGLSYSLNAMGTVVEGEWDDVMRVLRECRDRALETERRVFIHLSIDERPAEPLDRIREKVRAVEEELGGPSGS